MKLDQQVVSMELAKRLKELGVIGTALFWYQGRPEELETERGYAGPLYVRDLLGAYMQTENLVAAFTVAELGEMLIGRSLPFYDDGEWKSDGYYDAPSGRERITAETEAECRGRELAYLIENKLIEV